MRDILITNNRLTQESYKNGCEIVFIESSMKDVLMAVRDYIHKGHTLLSHPLSGSVKPGENPYKSVLISAQKTSAIDFDSLSIIENAIVTAGKFQLKYKNLTDEMRRDFEMVDYSLITSAFCNKPL